MRIICFTIIWLLGLITQVNAQTKAQIISDVRSTMEDFMADLSLVNEDKENSQQLLLDIADTYGSSEYFMRDNRQMNSFLSWLDSYCNIQLNGQVVQHTLTIQEQSLKKVDNKDKNDQRWTFEGKLHRSIFHSDKTMALPEKLLKLTVVWNGTKRYVKILSIDGEIPLIPFGADNIDDKLQQATAFLESETPDLAVHILAPMMANNKRAKEMMQKAVEWYRTMAEEGNIHAMNALGLCYELGAIVPQNTHLLFFIFQLGFVYFTGNMLQNSWGTLRFNLFYMVGLLGSLIGGLLTGYATNYYIHLSLLLAVAILYPMMQINLYGFLPIRMKWLAVVDLVLLLPGILNGAWGERVAIVVSLLNVALFFADRLLNNLKSARRRYELKKNWRTGKWC